LVTDKVLTFLGAIVQQSRFDQARDYLLSHGVSEQQMLAWMLSLLNYTIDGQGQLTRMGQRLFALLPERFDEMLQILETRQASRNSGLFGEFIMLLVKVQPPQLDLAWQAVQQRAQQASAESGYSTILGQCAS